MQSSTARSIIYASPSFSKLGNRISQNHKLNATTLEVTRRARIQGLAGRPLLRGDRRAHFLMTQITSIKNTPRNVTLFAKKKKQNGEGGLPPSPPHLLLARKNRFYL